MVGSARSFVAALVAIALATARAHIPSHDNILRIQLWDAEGLSRDPITTYAPTVPPKRKLEVNLESLNEAMLEEWYGSGRFTKHRVRHKRRRPRHSGDFPWKFHSGRDPINVLVYDPEVPWDVIETELKVNDSGVSVSAGSQREVSPPMTLRLPEEVMSGKQACLSTEGFFSVLSSPEVVNSHSPN
ncbi:unnamed protein product [Diatraea saccharalis]|uniref:Uncharacterized protein n=1 Tax=Diatraea saccharalis TaxID=40085 RepID=A0A9N9QZR4_9NEOP|nr:unnamed protein product [Diatraea saccharalis]